MQEPQKKGEGTPFRLPVEEELIERVAWLIRLRWFAALGVGLTTLAVSHFLGIHLPMTALLLVGTAIASYNGLFYLRLKRLRESPFAGVIQFSHFASFQFFIDWVALIFLVHYSGGIESPALFFFIFHVIIASILIPPKVCYLQATIGILMVGGLGLLEYLKILPQFNIGDCPSPAYDFPLFGLGIYAFFCSAIYGSIYLATSITGRLWARTRELARLKQSLENAYQRTETLYSMAKIVNSSLNLSEVLNAIVQQACRAMNAKASSIRLIDETEKRLELGAAFGLSENYLAKGPVNPGKSGVYREALEGKPVAVEDVFQDGQLQYPEKSREEGIRSTLTVPLIVRGKAIGTLRIYKGEVYHFTEEEIDFISALAEQGAVAIENAQAYRRLEELERVKSEFVYAFAHDLKGPLAAVQMLMDVLLERYVGEGSSKQRDLIVRVDQRLVGLQSLIRDLLALASLKKELPPAKRVEVEMKKVIRRIAEIVHPEVQKKEIEFSLDMPEAPAVILASEEDMERLVGNLVENAVKYTPPKGKVFLGLGMGTNELDLTVTDTGIGIPPESLPRIFEQLYRASNAKKWAADGTGMGLALVKRIIDQYKGTIKVESKLGEGTIFRVTLPINEKGS